MQKPKKEILVIQDIQIGMNKKLQLVFVLLTSLILSGCLKTESSSGKVPMDTTSVGSEVSSVSSNAIFSLLGQELPEKSLSRVEQMKRERNLNQARNNFETNPDSLENIIWYGRRLAYLGKYLESIEVYTMGLGRFPESYALLRHRGHRYITIRQFDKAIEDLTRAAFYVRDVDLEIEPDGIPNRLNKPLSNNKFNIWYHLGISYYLQGNFDKAISSFKKCMEASNNNDLIVATTNWFYMTYQKIGNTEAAQELLKTIDPKIRPIENQKYLDLLLLYKGINLPGKLLNNNTNSNNSIDPTVGYGLGSWYLNQGQVETAKDIFEQVLRNPAWDAFGYIATEVEYKLLSGN